MQSALMFPWATQSLLLQPGLPYLADQARLVAPPPGVRSQSPSKQQQHFNGTPLISLQQQQATSQSTTAGQPPLQAIRPKRPVRTPESIHWSPTRELLSEPQKPLHQVMKVGTQLARSQQMAPQHLLKSVCKALGPTSRPPSKASIHLAAALQAAAVSAAQQQQPQDMRQQQQQQQQQHPTMQQLDSNEEASQQQPQVSPLQQSSGLNWQSQGNPQLQHSQQQQQTQLQQVSNQQLKQQLMHQGALATFSEALGRPEQQPAAHLQRQQQQQQRCSEQRDQHGWHSGSAVLDVSPTLRAAAVHGDVHGDEQRHDRTQCQAAPALAASQQDH